MGSDVSHNTASEASVSETNGVPFVEQVHLFVKPMRLKLIMKLEKYESTARYRLGPDGKPLLIEQTSDMFGSGMGQGRTSPHRGHLQRVPRCEKQTVTSICISLG